MSEELKQDKKWIDSKPDEVKRRVFRANNPLTKVGIHTIEEPAKVIDGIKHPALSIKIKPNKAGQYVLSESAVEYARQLKVLRSRKDIYEVELSWEGIPYAKPPEPTPEEKRLKKEVAEKDIELDKLRKELEKFMSKGK